MPPLSPQPHDSGPFGRHDFELGYGRLESSREVDIRALANWRPVVGDIYTFSREKAFYDVIVTEIAGADGGGWNARCKVIDLQWI